MRKLAFALFALSFAALPSSPAAASCYQSPCAGYVYQPAWNPCCNTGPAYWVQQVAQPAYVSPCCAQPHYYQHHQTYAPAVYRPHRPYFRPYRLVRPAFYHPHLRPLVRPMLRPHLRPLHRTYRAPMFRPHRTHLRPLRYTVQQPRLMKPMMQRPHQPGPDKPAKK